MFLRRRQALIRVEGDDLPLRGDFLQCGRRVSGHRHYLRGDLAGVILCRGKVSPRGPTRGRERWHWHREHSLLGWGG
eukprot:2726798-Amphidinium_carterae.1